MRARKHKAGFLALVIVLGTALMGSAYALWFEDLTLTANVTTGTLDALISCSSPVENEDPSWSTTHQPEAPYPDPGKEVGSVTGTSTGPHEYLITVTGGYPGYMVDCETHLSNNGTVPWHIETEEIEVYLDENGPNPPPPVLLYTGVCDPPDPFSHGFCVAGDISPTNPSGDPIYVKFNDVRGCQVHPGNEVAGSVYIGINQSALEGTTYVIKLKFRVHQWNESDWDNCGDVRTQSAPSNAGEGSTPSSGTLT